MGAVALIEQHLIDPEVCIRCNTCESICPQKAITHDARNYAVSAQACKHCMDCIAPCPTGAIDHWRTVVRAQAYGVDEQLGWDALPRAWSAQELAAQQALAGQPDQGALGCAKNAETSLAAAPAVGDAAPALAAPAVVRGARVPPWSAAHPYTQLYGPKAAQASVTATVSGNLRVTALGSDYDTHHIVLDLGRMPFPVLEGQSIGILPPGRDAQGRAHHARQYSVASARNGERPGYNNLALTVKRVLVDHAGHAVRGVASNYLCDLKVGDTVQVTGPFGSSFLMPNHPQSHLVMVCTGTGSAPMRAMTEWRRRQRQAGRDDLGRLLLFFGARSREELPYFGPLQRLGADFIDIHFAFSRMPGAPRRYVQDALREQAAQVGKLLRDPGTHIYVCGLRAMEDGVLHALADCARQAGLDWEPCVLGLEREGRLHLETY
ncbi:MAG: benzoyl-CoA 2,3-epoxidase subunit BoxA [Rhodoferax sp.]